MNVTVNQEQLRTLGCYIPTKCGSTMQYDPADAILYGAVSYITNLEQTISHKDETIRELCIISDDLEAENMDLISKAETENKNLEDDHEHLKGLYDKLLDDYVTVRSELRAYRLVAELVEKYPDGHYDESDGVQYLKNLLDSNVDKS
jgi:hypothetical protein